MLPFQKNNAVSEVVSLFFCIFSKKSKTMNYKTSILGRKHEQDLIREYYQSPKAELVAVYGRRRVGKTYLVKQFFQRG